MTQPHVALVVVSFGHAAQLPATLRSIAELRYPSERLHLIVVDNRGDSAALVRELAPHALVLEPGRNLGFAAGCNLAVQHTTAEIIILVNPDVEVMPDFVNALLVGLQEPGVGIVGAKLLFPDNTTLQHAGGELQLPLGLTNHRGYGNSADSNNTQDEDVDYVTGAALAIRRTTWLELRGFDEIFSPAYYEEVDLCLRVRQAGLQIRYIPAAIALHGETSALGRASIAFYRLYHTNRLRLLFKHWDNSWLTTTWLPAELLHLRTTANDHEIDGLIWAYRNWQAHFLTGNEELSVQFPDWQTAPALPELPSDSELAWLQGSVELKQTVVPQSFRSRLPGVVRLRQWWNRVATEEYLRPLIQQQNDFNATITQLSRALERQRRTADGAVLCQGMLLAKILKVRSET